MVHFVTSYYMTFFNVSACIRVFSEIPGIVRLSTYYRQKSYRPKICVTGMIMCNIFTYMIVPVSFVSISLIYYLFSK